jgi:hypothetical protein
MDRAAQSSALWARSLAINVLALAICRFVLDGFEIHGVWGYALAAVGIELPTLLWWLTVRLWQRTAFSDRGIEAVAATRGRSVVFVALLIVLVFVVPLALVTSAPGLLVAEWISSLTIDGFWTYVAACAMTTAHTLAFRQSRPLRYMLAFVRGERRDGIPQPLETPTA